MKIELAKIRPDPNQPRKIIDEESVKHLAQTMGVAGLLQRIEVDKDNVIIFGELRYRAAKLLGWKEIEVQVNKAEITPYERLRRQMIENLQQSGSKAGGGQPMNTIDTAKAWVRLYEFKTGKGYVLGTHPLVNEKTTGGIQRFGIFKTIAKEVGVDKHTVWEYLRTLEEPKYVIEDLLKGRPRTYYREVQEANIPNEETRNKIKSKIATGEYKNREEIRREIQLVQKDPGLSILNLNRKLDKESTSANKILNAVTTLSLVLKDNPLESINPAEKNIIRGQLEWVKGRIENYLEGGEEIV